MNPIHRRLFYHIKHCIRRIEYTRHIGSELGWTGKETNAIVWLNSYVILKQQTINWKIMSKSSKTDEIYLLLKRDGDYCLGGWIAKLLDSVVSRSIELDYPAEWSAAHWMLDFWHEDGTTMVKKLESNIFTVLSPRFALGDTKLQSCSRLCSRVPLSKFFTVDGNYS